MLYSINYIYYQALKTQIRFNEGDITLEFNRSLFTIITAVCYSNRRVVTQTPKLRARVIQGKVGELQTSASRSQYGFRRSRR